MPKTNTFNRALGSVFTSIISSNNIVKDKRIKLLSIGHTMYGFSEFINRFRMIMDYKRHHFEKNELTKYVANNQDTVHAVESLNYFDIRDLGDKDQMEDHCSYTVAVSKLSQILSNLNVIDLLTITDNALNHIRTKVYRNEDISNDVRNLSSLLTTKNDFLDKSEEEMNILARQLNNTYQFSYMFSNMKEFSNIKYSLEECSSKLVDEKETKQILRHISGLAADITNARSYKLDKEISNLLLDSSNVLAKTLNVYSVASLNFSSMNHCLVCIYNKLNSKVNDNGRKEINR